MAERKRGERGKHYRVRWGRGVESVTRAQWQEAVAVGWINPIDTNVAELAVGVRARLVGRELILWIVQSFNSLHRRSP
jgi:hypothetical protein